MKKDAAREVDNKKQELTTLKEKIKQAQKELDEKEYLKNKEQNEVNRHFEDKVRKLEGLLSNEREKLKKYIDQEK